MKVCLLSALTMSDFGDAESTLSANMDHMTPPLGVLSIAAALCDRGITPQVVNLNKLFLDFVGEDRSENGSNFLKYVLNHMNSLSFEILGLSTICSSYPLTIRIAEAIKGSRPSIGIILGGPQASVVDVPTMKAFPFIDFVVRGEADNTFPILIEALSGKASAQEIEKIPGITFRRGADIIQNPDSPPISDLDRLPLPAYFLDPNIKNYKSLSMEAGRGCPFGCTFCSTSGFFGRKYRVKSPQKLIEQMKSIKEMYGIDNIDLHHDNFTVNRKKVIEFCEGLLNCGDHFDWGCSSRTDQIDEELIALMSKAGCDGIFFGVETGSARLQKEINKNLNLLDAERHIRSVDGHGIKMAVALITGFPEETRDDLRDTVNFFVDMLRFDNVEPQLSLLAPLVGSEIHSIYRDKLILDYNYSDISFQGMEQSSDDRGMIQAYPDVFPNFYTIPTSYMDRTYFKEVMDFLTYLREWLLWLPLALFLDSGDMLEVFDRWRLWRSTNLIEDPDSSKESYYKGRKFPEDFIEFVRSYYNKEMAFAKETISDVIEIENLVLDREEGPVTQSNSDHGIFGLTSFPYKPAGLHTAKIGVDYKELIQCLKNKGRLENVPSNKVTLAFRKGHADQTKANVLILSPLSEELLGMCDGSRNVSDIVYQSSSLKADVDGVPPEKARFFGLSQLFKQELIKVSTQPQVGHETVHATEVH